MLHPERLRRRHVEHRPGDELGGGQRGRRLAAGHLREAEVDQLRRTTSPRRSRERKMFAGLMIAGGGPRRRALGRAPRRSARGSLERVLEGEEMNLERGGSEIAPRAGAPSPGTGAPDSTPDVENARPCSGAPEAGGDASFPDETALVSCSSGDEVLVKHLDRPPVCPSPRWVASNTLAVAPRPMSRTIPYPPSRIP